MLHFATNLDIDNEQDAGPWPAEGIHHGPPLRIRAAHAPAPGSKIFSRPGFKTDSAAQIVTGHWAQFQCRGPRGRDSNPRRLPVKLPRGVNP